MNKGVYEPKLNSEPTSKITQLTHHTLFCCNSQRCVQRVGALSLQQGHFYKF